MAGNTDGCDAWFTIEPPPPPPTFRVWARTGGEQPAVFDWEGSVGNPRDQQAAINEARRQGYERALVVVK